MDCSQKGFKTENSLKSPYYLQPYLTWHLQFIVTKHNVLCLGGLQLVLAKQLPLGQCLPLGSTAVSECWRTERGQWQGPDAVLVSYKEFLPYRELRLFLQLQCFILKLTKVASIPGSFLPCNSQAHYYLAQYEAPDPKRWWGRPVTINNPNFITIR